MKFLIYSDLQAADGGERCFSDPTRPLQRWRVETLLAKLLDIYTTERCSGLIDLGDTTDDRQAIPIPTIHAVLSALEHFKGGNNIKLMGNHEQHLRSPELHSGIMYAPTFEVVKTWKTLSFDGCPVDFACVSYIEDEQALKAAISEAVSMAHKKTVLLGHFSVSGSMAHGTKIEDGLKRADIPSVNLTLLGHIHKHQEVYPNVFYVGSPFQQDFGEINEKKYVAILDTRTLQLKWIDTQMPQYHRCSLDQFKAYALDGSSEDRFEVRLKSFDEAKEFYGLTTAYRATPVYDFIEKTVHTKDSVSVNSFDVQSLLRQYVDLHPPDKKGLQMSAEDLVHCGNEFMAE